MRFLSTYKDASRINILSLGAGYDVTFFCLQDIINENPDFLALKSKLVYIEVDFEEIVSKKISVLKKNEVLLKHISEDAKHSDNDDHHIEGFGVLEVNYPHYKLFA